MPCVCKRIMLFPERPSSTKQRWDTYTTTQRPSTTVASLLQQTLSGYNDRFKSCLQDPQRLYFVQMQGPDSHVGRKVREFSFKKLLGKGSFGSVYLVDDTLSNCSAACKVIDKKKITETPKLGELINNEICVLFNCQSQNVVSYRASFETPQHIYIVMEFCNGGDVDTYVNKKPNGRLEEKEAVEILRQVVNGFRSVRSIGAVHRDLKAENLMIHNEVVKIADFGFSKVIPNQHETQTVLGTLYTMAPEVIAKQSYNHQCDIWSVGIIFYKLIEGRYPYRGPNYAEMLKRIKSIPVQFDPSIPISDLSKDFILKCLVIDPTKRITWKEIENHPLLKSQLQQAQLPILKKPSLQLKKTKQFYVRNTPFLNIKNPPSFPDVELASQLTEERLKDPMERRILQNRVFSYYQEIYLSIQEYIMERLKYGIFSIEEYKNLCGEFSAKVSFIIVRDTYRMMSKLYDSLAKKVNLLQFQEMHREFFNSQECQSLVNSLSVDLQTLAKYTTHFQSQIQPEEIQKLTVSEGNRQDKVIQREKRELIQCMVKLFNNVDHAGKEKALEVMLLVKFLIDDVSDRYKDPDEYASFLKRQTAKDAWLQMREELVLVSKNYK